MPTSHDPDINDYVPITPTHVKVEVIADDEEVDPTVKVGIDTEKAKAIDLCYTWKDFVDHSKAEYYYVHDPRFEKWSNLLLRQKQDLDDEFRRVATLLYHADKLDHYYQIIQEFGINKQIAELLSMDYELTKMPAMESLSTDVGTPYSPESVMALEGLGDFLTRMWENLKSAFTNIGDKIQHTAKIVSHLSQNITGDIRELKQLLTNTTLSAHKLQTHKCRIPSSGRWTEIANAMAVVTLLRDATAFLQYIEKFTDTHYSDYLIAAFGTASAAAGLTSRSITLDTDAIIGNIAYRLMIYFNRDKLKAVGIQLRNNDKPIFKTDYIQESLPTTESTLIEHGWSQAKLLETATMAFNMSELGNKLPFAYDKMQKQTSRSLRIVETVLVGKVFLDTDKARELKLERLRLKLKLEGFNILQQIMWHCAKVNIACSKIWVDAARHALSCKEDQHDRQI